MIEPCDDEESDDLNSNEDKFNTTADEAEGHSGLDKCGRLCHLFSI